MTTDANRSAAFYCPLHQVRFNAIPAEVVQCDQGSHAVGYGFPQESLWTYCCACATFSPHELASHNSQLNECPVCERQVAKRCLCHSCKVITIESVALVHRKIHSIDSGGVKPNCPGCGSASSGAAVVQHDCPELNITFLTARPSCEFCELPVVNAHQQEPEAADEESIDQEFILDSIDEPGVESIPESTPETEPTYTSPWDYTAAPVPSKRRTPWLIGGAAALLSVAILVAVAVSKSGGPTTPKDPKGPIPNAHAQAPPGMVYIARGEFLMGNNAGDEYEKPVHKVAVGPFYMDVNEVTCEEYLKFLTATLRHNPSNWTSRTCQPNAARQPVTGIDWTEAKSYADWAHKRLPTEEEWEFAARGVLSATYPWGNEWRSNAANAGDSSAQRLMDVGSYPNGKTSSGLMDLIGNAWEWTSSDVVVYPGGSLSSPIPEDVKVVRGGSWQAGRQATSTYRGFLHITNAKDYSATGFRCVKDVGPESAAAEPQKRK